MNKALLSSKNMCWCTPQDFFDKLNEEFSFTLDAAATDKTAKCPLYFTPETDGLKSSWKVAGGGVQYFAIPRMGAKSESGFKRHTKRRRPEHRLSFLFRRVPIQAISTILYIFTELRPPCDMCGGEAVTIRGITPTGHEATITLTAAGFDFEGCAEDTALLQRIRKARCIYAGTREGTQRAVRIQCDCEGERPCKAYLYDHE